jgi:hypothetical protein
MYCVPRSLPLPPQQLRQRVTEILDKADRPQALPFNAITLDYYLWDTAKEQAETMQHIKIHRTRCIQY